ncbi:MAG: non-canonical purine NTP pyrophosphatase [Candidatus Taylorbacteria bacterium]
MKKVFLATNNEGKIQRFRRLLKSPGFQVELFTPKDVGLSEIKVEEKGKTLEENAELKVRAYFGKVDMSILANDTGFYVEGKGFIDAPKRHALKGKEENKMSKEEISKEMLEFWKGIVTKYGGKVDAAWVEAFVVIHPNGKVKKATSRREIILTDQEFGKPHIQMPLRALYISKTTGKPAIQHSPEEELIEMQPVIDALTKVLS